MEPLGLVSGPAAFHAMRQGFGLPLQGGNLAFLMVRLIEDGATRAVVPVAEIPAEFEELIPALTMPLPPFAGLRTGGPPLVMGIVNATPDSFSGDGVLDPGAAIAQGEAMVAAGADLLDIGGESTRPGAEPVGPAEEQRRVLPLVRALSRLAWVSIDTRHATTMAAALDAGATIVNDVSALRHDGDALQLLVTRQAPLVMMHMLGTDPRTMQRSPSYADVALEVARFLRDRLETLGRLGIPRDHIALDPGIGFGKTPAHNLELLERLPLLAGLGCHILVGASRKRFIGLLAGTAGPSAERMPGSLAVALAAKARGARILRVHDVAATVQALRVAAAIGLGARGVPAGS